MILTDDQIKWFIEAKSISDKDAIDIVEIA